MIKHIIVPSIAVAVGEVDLIGLGIAGHGQILVDIEIFEDNFLDSSDAAVGILRDYDVAVVSPVCSPRVFDDPVPIFCISN